MTSHDALYRRLAKAFREHARYRARPWDVEVDDFENWMWEVTFAKAATVEHACGPLLEQTEHYIALWAARYAVKRAERERHHEVLSESITYNPEPKRLTDFADYVERIGNEWGIDIGDAVDIIASGEVSPEFEEYIRALGPRDARVAALLLSGLRPYHIYKKDDAGESFESERATKKVCKQLIQILKKAA